MSALFWRFPYQWETPRRALSHTNVQTVTQTKHANNTYNLRHRPMRTLRVSIAEIKKKKKRKTQNKTRQNAPVAFRTADGFSPGSHFVSLILFELKIHLLSFYMGNPPEGEPHFAQRYCKGRVIRSWHFKRSKRELGDGKQGKSMRDCERRWAKILKRVWKTSEGLTNF